MLNVLHVHTLWEISQSDYLASRKREELSEIQIGLKQFK